MSSAIPLDTQGQVGPQESGSAPAGYNPSPEEQKSVRLVDHLFNKAKNARKAYDEKWLDNYKMFRGKQWKDLRPSYRHSEVINLIFRAIQSEVPILTDRMPRPEFTPQEPQDQELAQIFNDLLESDWRDGNWDFKLTEVVYDGHLYGTGFASVKFDEEAAMGAGRIVFQSEDPFGVYPDPSARDVNETCNYFVFAEPKDVERLKREYPDKKQYIKPDIIDLSRNDKSSLIDYTRYIAPSTGRTVIDGYSSGGGMDMKGRDEALKVELYIHDDEYCEEDQSKQDPQTGEVTPQFVQKLKYPNGRHIVTVNGVMCEDGPIPYDDNQFPFVKWTNYILPREFWAMSEVEQLESPQKIFNKLISFSLDVLTLMGNPIWIVDNTSGVDTDNLFSRPGLILEKEPGSEVRREEGVQLQPYVMQMIDRVKGWFDDVSGNNDVSRGAKPEGVTAASAIQALQEAAQTRLRQKTRNTDTFLQNFGKMYMARAKQFYSSPRVFRITGVNNVTKYFKFHIDRQDVLDESGQPTGDKKSIARVRRFNEGSDGQHYLGEEQQYNADVEFDVKVSTGSSLPFEKDRIEQQSYALFDRGIIDAEEVLKNIKYPNAEAVMQRQADRAALQAQQAQAQGEAQAQPPPQS